MTKLALGLKHLTTGEWQSTRKKSHDGMFGSYEQHTSAGNGQNYLIYATPSRLTTLCTTVKNIHTFV